MLIFPIFTISIY